MASSTCRLGFLILPKLQLLSSLDLEGDHFLCEPATVITPELDYEEAFEGWKRAWIAKAKQDFVADIINLCSREFPIFTDQLRDDPTHEHFDRWWTISEVSVLDIDPSWRPS